MDSRLRKIGEGCEGGGRRRPRGAHKALATKEAVFVCRRGVRNSTRRGTVNFVIVVSDLKHQYVFLSLSEIVFPEKSVL